MSNNVEFELRIREYRKKIVQMHGASRTSHIGSSLSAIDIIAVLYNRIMKVDPSRPDWTDRDRFILSKGHAAPALYVVLHDLGFFDERLINEYGMEGTSLFEHPEKPSAPGIDTSTGSLGHGLPIGIGMAYALLLSRMSSFVFVLMSDGECQEGSTWEAVMLASALKLHNLICVIDYNNLQGFGRTADIQDEKKIMGRFSASGWSVVSVNGHDISELENAFLSAKASGNGPTLVLARTIKGKGIKKIEDKLEWHYKSPSPEEVSEFIKELDGK